MHLPHFPLSPPPKALSKSQQVVMKQWAANPEQAAQVLLTHGETAHVSDLESALSSYLSGTGSQQVHSLAVSSASMGLELLYEAFDLKAGDEVITAAFGWPDTIAPLIHKEIQMVYVDVDATATLDPATISAAVTEKTRAVVVVAPQGLLPDLKALKKVCEAHGLFLILDAAQALGSSLVSGEGLAAFVDGLVFSFSGKLVHAGEGGLVATPHAHVFEYMMSRSQHPQRQRWHLSQTQAFPKNGRIHGMAATLATAGWQDLRRELKQRQTHFFELVDALKTQDDLIGVPLAANTQPNAAGYLLKLKPTCPDICITPLLTSLRHKGVPIKPSPVPLILPKYSLPEYGHNYRLGSLLTQSKEHSQRGLTLEGWVFNYPTDIWLEPFLVLLKEAFNTIKKKAV